MRVSLFDLLSMSWASGLRPSEVYERCCALAPLGSPLPEGGALRFVRRLTVRLRLPCPFLRGGRCDIYRGRALTCALFPEGQYLRGWDARLEDYPCLWEPQPLSPERRRVLEELERRAAEESLVSDVWLFGYSPFLVAFERDDRLLEAARRWARRRGLPEREERLLIPQEAFEELLERELAGGEFTEAVRQRVSRLDRPEGVEELFRMRELLLAHPPRPSAPALHRPVRGGFRLAS